MFETIAAESLMYIKSDNPVLARGRIRTMSSKKSWRECIRWIAFLSYPYSVVDSSTDILPPHGMW